jgi:para-aminobenzoate synthetase/4-amino-4-deoxychorismate lyase
MTGDRLRLVARPDGRVEAEGGRGPAAPEDVVLAPVVLPGGLGAHKWADRRLPDALGPALLLDADGAVLEATWASVATGDGRTPPADGRLLPGTTRARALASGLLREAPLVLEDLVAGLVLLSAVRGPHVARLDGAPAPGGEVRERCARLRAALGWGPAEPGYTGSMRAVGIGSSAASRTSM